MRLSNLPEVPKLIYRIRIQVSLTLKGNVTVEEKCHKRTDGENCFHFG